MDVVVPIGTRFNKRKRNPSIGPRKKPRLWRQGALRGQAAFQGSYANRSSSYGLNQGNHGPELKDIETAVTGASLDTTGSVTLLNGVAQGQDLTDRIGRKFSMKSILLRFTVIYGAAAVSGSIARWLIVYDKQTNGVAPAVLDVLTVGSPTAFNNLTNRDRFIVIYDKIHNIGTGPANDNGFSYVMKYRKCNLETTNGGTGATVASIATGGLFLIGVSDRPAGTTAPRFESASVRVRFTDD